MVGVDAPHFSSRADRDLTMFGAQVGSWRTIERRERLRWLAHTSPRHSTAVSNVVTIEIVEYIVHTCLVCVFLVLNRNT